MLESQTLKNVHHQPCNVGSPPRCRCPARTFLSPELDCLRFVAFFAIFIFHTSGGGDAAHFAARGVRYSRLIASAASAGRFGVDLFFLLSAYLITELRLREQELCGRLDLRFFYLRRILCIWPLYFFCSSDRSIAPAGRLPASTFRRNMRWHLGSRSGTGSRSISRLHP
jgi:peptidoglycan/LPS O-acetylase OafA/YrhL